MIFSPHSGRRVYAVLRGPNNLTGDASPNSDPPAARMLQ